MKRSRGVVLKSPRELALMREAGRVNAKALAAAVVLAVPGAKCSDLEEAAAEVLRIHGAKPAFMGVPGAYPYPAVTTISVNEELVHGIPGDRELKEGDIVSIDCGTILNGFVGDSAITVGVGQVSDEAQRLMDVTFRSLMEGIAEMRLGSRTGDVSAAIQRYVERHHFNVVREYSGHGIGRSMWEDPQVPNYGEPGRGLELREGMVIALEPMVLAGSPETKVLADKWTVASRDGRLTAHFEHSVAVTKNGPQILTTLDGDLDEDPLRHYNYYFAGQSAVVTD
jgi:methionyl aminopeptidase